MRPYLWALGVIWGTWFATLAGTSAYADATGQSDVSAGPYLAFWVGTPLAILFTVIAVAGIAAGQCWDACERRAHR
jgi:hypothetical protein